MRRILLVIEDYNELLYVEKSLKKVGFDVESLPSEASLPERMMGFLPDLVIATGDGNRVSGHSVSKKVKRKGVQSLLLLLFPRQRLSQIDIATYAAEGVIETPINPRVLIKSVCDFLSLSSETILTKFEKFLPPESEENEVQVIKERKKPVPPPSQTTAKRPQGDGRAEKYKQLLENVPESPVKIFDHQTVEAERRYQKNLPDTPEEAALDENRKEFVKKLYKDWKK